MNKPTLEVTNTDNYLLTFTTGHRRWKCDAGTFWGWRVKAWAKIDGKKRLVGRWGGDTYAEQLPTWQRADRKAEEMVRHLKASRLYIISLDKWAIEAGTERDCSTCAIAQALWKKQPSIGLPRHEWHFRVSTYAAWAEADGLTLKADWAEGEIAIEPDKLPDVVTNYRRGGKDLTYHESMVDWTQSWDEWAESRGLTEKQWLDESKDHELPMPHQPSPAFFVLNWDDFQTTEPGTWNTPETDDE